MISLPAGRRDIAAGAQAIAPWLAGIVPFKLVIGAGAAQTDLPTLAGWPAGPLIYAGRTAAPARGLATCRRSV